ncbi:Similar to Cdk7: Cyclin-dependent kinase 7 (Mus musculus) [Cotesia congregata]|uniref:[RNA-polymerase]-subunit kinase n=1 Tax=Cotesia congregata TaxID=51543 RepID=A0A8J2HFV7_COTCN|nr:Similar to Cdk7: Cyclin-dependent kinase 7 (Mus musculus) [Cotesia congregata]
MAEKLRRYEKIDFLGEGQFATVYKAKDTETDQIVAVKKHDNIIGLLDVFGYKSNVSLVFDFMDTDLEIIIKDSSIVFTISHIKSYMIQTLQGLDYLHCNWILHRDLKPNNLLVNQKGILKIEETWPGMTELTDFIQFKPFIGIPFSDIFTAVGADLLDLISSLLRINPSERCTCSQALQMPFFSNKPAPTPGDKLPLPISVRRLKENRPSLKRKLLENIDGGTLAKRLQF